MNSNGHFMLSSPKIHLHISAVIKLKLEAFCLYFY